MRFKTPISVVSPSTGEHATNKDYVDGKTKTITWEAYNQLTEEEQKNGTIYFIEDIPSPDGSPLDEFIRTTNIKNDVHDECGENDVFSALTMQQFVKQYSQHHYLTTYGLGSIDGTGVDNALGITENSLSNIAEHMPAATMLLFDSATAVDYYGLPNKFFNVFWARRYGGRDLILASNIYGGELYFCVDIAAQKWVRVCTSSTIIDIAETKLTFVGTNYVNSGDTYSHYTVENGICYYSVCVKCVTASSANVKVVTGLPKARSYWAERIDDFNTDTGASIKYYIDPAGDLYIRGGTANSTYIFKGSYPVNG